MLRSSLFFPFIKIGYRAFNIIFCKKTVDKTGISVYTVYIASFFFSLT